jgi:hypothetical protein
MPRLAHLLTGFLIVLSSSFALAGSVQEHRLKSKALDNNSLGIPSQRQLYVYLPDGYEHSNERYPVIYYLPNFDQKIDQSVITALDKAITKGDIPPVIFVSADFRVKDGINFFGNNEVVGHWLDFIHSELRVWVESNYRVKRKAEHRAISGHFLGAYAAIKLAMLYPDTYGTAYGLHPVATESSDLPFLYKPDWNEIHAAKDYARFNNPASLPFINMAQAHLPNPNNPPFYADFIVELKDGELVPNVAHIRKLKQTFHLGDLTANYAENLQKLRGIGMDWGRKDAILDHVIGARRYSVLLENFGIQHEAEEHQGNGWDYDFSPQGKISTRMLPFLGKHLVP